jgi:hypothetical protein
MTFCDFCNTELSSISALNKHKRTSRYCIKIQEQNLDHVSDKQLFNCEHCNKELTSKYRLQSHLKICKTKKEQYKNEMNEYKNEMKEMMEKVLQLTKEVERIKENPSTTKNEFEFVSEHLETNDSNIIDVDDIKEYKFGNNFIVPIRSDGMINATTLCKAGGKQLDHYKENLQTKQYLDELSSVTGIPVSELFNHIIGGKYPGTWVHRKVGYHLAQWISPKFALHVSLILDELFTKLKQPDEIDNEYKRQISTLKTKLETNTEQYQKLLIKHNSSLKTHRYIKFKKTDPCFYIIDSGVDCDCLRYKFGITGLDQDNIDDRLRCHRTLWPQLKVRYLLFVKDVYVIEKNFKMMFDKEINPNGHEIIEGVKLDEMIGRIEKLFDILCIKEYHIMSEEKLKEYNDYVDTTIKVI